MIAYRPRGRVCLHQCLHQLRTNQQRRGQFLTKWRTWTPPPRNAKTLDSLRKIKGFPWFLPVGVARFELATSCTPKATSPLQKRPLFPSFCAILAVPTSIANPLIPSHSFSGNSSILEIPGARKTVICIHNKKGLSAAHTEPLDSVRGQRGQVGHYRQRATPRSWTVTIDTRLSGGYNIGQPGGAGPSALKALVAYPPGLVLDQRRLSALRSPEPGYASVLVPMPPRFLCRRQHLVRPISIIWPDNHHGERVLLTFDQHAIRIIHVKVDAERGRELGGPVPFRSVSEGLFMGLLIDDARHGDAVKAKPTPNPGGPAIGGCVDPGSQPCAHRSRIRIRVPSRSGSSATSHRSSRGIGCSVGTSAR
jgi:hypothetical protein